MTEDVSIANRDYWFKFVEFLQHNWALVNSDQCGTTGWFIDHTSGVLDQITFSSIEDALVILSRNGFCRFADNKHAQTYLSAPEPPFVRWPHPDLLKRQLLEMMVTTGRKKLIEVALPLDAINKASAREKSIRHGHPSTLHLWWARRPLATARAVIFAQMVDDPSTYVTHCLIAPR